MTSVRAAVNAYDALRPDLNAATEDYRALITSLLDDAGINYLSVTGRTKSVASFAAKAERCHDGERLYPDPLTDITDQIGLRVITYVHSDVAAVADLLAEELTVLDDRDLGQEVASSGRFGYSSRHLLVRAGARSGPAVRHDASVQLRTVLQHAWAEFEHDIRYKGTIPAEHAADLDRRFTLAAGLLELADREFSTIRARLRAGLSTEEPRAEEGQDPAGDPRIDPGDLATFVGQQYPDASWSRADHYGWMSGLLLELGITSLEELAGLLASLDAESIDAKMGYRFPAGVVRRLDDALLAVFGQRYIDLHGNQHRVGLLRARLDKLRA